MDRYLRYTYPYGIFARIEDIKQEIARRGIAGVIHYVQAFCYRMIEDIILKETLGVPVITIEGDLPKPLDTRTKLRLEAFAEMLEGKSWMETVRRLIMNREGIGFFKAILESYEDVALLTVLDGKKGEVELIYPTEAERDGRVHNGRYAKDRHRIQGGGRCLTRRRCSRPLRPETCSTRRRSRRRRRRR